MITLEIIKNDIKNTINNLKKFETVEYRELAKKENLNINEIKRYETEKFRRLLESRDKLELKNVFLTNKEISLTSLIYKDNLYY
jgi:hypothetical protein